MVSPTSEFSIGNRVAPLRFLFFIAIAILGTLALVPRLGYAHGIMGGFDAAALVFLLSCLPLLNDREDEMRDAARKNAVNRALILVITGFVMLVVLVVVFSELHQSSDKHREVAWIIATLALSWLFSNMMYALHYAHKFYKASTLGGDCGGPDFPKTSEPNYWDFVYFAYCIGMTFQTSDTEITDRVIRRTVTFHTLGAFIFNLGVLAFTINILGSSR